MSLLQVTRRDFLRYGLGSAGGLVLGVSLPGAARLARATTGATTGATASGAAFEPNAFVRVGADDVVTVIVKHIEFGQGTFTGLPTLVADEMDADWNQLAVEGAPADPARYHNLNWGQSQGTGGSSSMNNAYMQMRRAGRTARAMLVAAAARAWQVAPGEVSVSAGVVRHAGSGRAAGFGELADAAAREPMPKNVVLKTPQEFVYIGRDVPRTDRVAKSTGTAVYTQDFSLPGMLTALVAHPPRYGARPATVDDRAALALDGVRRVVTLPTSVAVVADSFWQASRGRDALAITWDDADAWRGSTDELTQDYRQLARSPGMEARNDGDIEAALANATTVLEAGYECPYLAHAAMEPMNAVAQFDGGRLRMWYGVQSQSTDLRNLGRTFGLAREDIELNMLYAGGSFGRRAHGGSDYVLEAARIAQAMGDATPVKLVWTREDDMRAGAYRPLNVHRLRGGLDGDGRIVAWDHVIVGQSILAGTPFRSITDRIDETCIEGAADLPYTIDNLRVTAHQPEVPVPVLWWRSVGHTHTAFSTEIFLDELAAAAGRDPLALRLELLPEDPRRRRVLETAAAAAGWGEPLPAGRGRGIAVHYCFKTWVAEVAEVSVADDGSFTVDRVVVAVDCGLAVNPAIVRAQMSGGVGYALSAVHGGAVTIVDGIVQEDNFDRYPVLRNGQMPDVEVHIVPSQEAPTGVGEPAVPPLAPAVSNAIFAASGVRLRALPFTRVRAG